MSHSVSHYQGHMGEHGTTKMTTIRGQNGGLPEVHRELALSEPKLLHFHGTHHMKVQAFLIKVEPTQTLTSSQTWPGSETCLVLTQDYSFDVIKQISNAPPCNTIIPTNQM